MKRETQEELRRKTKIKEQQKAGVTKEGGGREKVNNERKEGSQEKKTTRQKRKVWKSDLGTRSRMWCWWWNSRKRSSRRRTTRRTDTRRIGTHGLVTLQRSTGLNRKRGRRKRKSARGRQNSETRRGGRRGGSHCTILILITSNIQVQRFEWCWCIQCTSTMRLGRLSSDDWRRREWWWGRNMRGIEAMRERNRRWRGWRWRRRRRRKIQNWMARRGEGEGEGEGAYARANITAFASAKEMNSGWIVVLWMP